MSDISREEKACAGIGLSAGAAGIVTISGASTAAGGGMIAAGITNCVAAAPGIAKLAIIGGQTLCAFPVLAPVAIVGGLSYAVYNFICSATEN